VTALASARVSVVMPVLNGARYIAEALDSLLAQTRPPHEVIVVDDGSTDDSGAIAAAHALRPRCLRQPQGGIAAARNAGFAIATGDVFMLLDADDLAPPASIAARLAALDAAPGAAMAFGGVEPFACPHLPEAERARLAVPPAQPGRMSGTLLVRRAAFEAVGPFDPSLRSGEFIDWYMRAVEAGFVDAMAPEIVLRRRIHHANHGFLRRDARSDYVRLIRSALARRRGAGTG